MACSGCAERRAWLKKLRDQAYEQSKRILGIATTADQSTAGTDSSNQSTDGSNEQSGSEQSGVGSSDH